MSHHDTASAPASDGSPPQSPSASSLSDVLSGLDPDRAAGIERALSDMFGPRAPEVARGIVDAIGEASRPDLAAELTKVVGPELGGTMAAILEAQRTAPTEAARDAPAARADAAQKVDEWVDRVGDYNDLVGKRDLAEVRYDHLTDRGHRAEQLAKGHEERAKDLEDQAAVEADAPRAQELREEASRAAQLADRMHDRAEELWAQADEALGELEGYEPQIEQAQRDIEAAGRAKDVAEVRADALEARAGLSGDEAAPGARAAPDPAPEPEGASTSEATSSARGSETGARTEPGEAQPEPEGERSPARAEPTAAEPVPEPGPRQELDALRDEIAEHRYAAARDLKAAKDLRAEADQAEADVLRTGEGDNARLPSNDEGAAAFARAATLEETADAMERSAAESTMKAVELQEQADALEAQLRTPSEEAAGAADAPVDESGPPTAADVEALKGEIAQNRYEAARSELTANELRAEAEQLEAEAVTAGPGEGATPPSSQRGAEMFREAADKRDMADAMDRQGQEAEARVDDAMERLAELQAEVNAAPEPEIPQAGADPGVDAVSGADHAEPPPTGEGAAEPQVGADYDPSVEAPGPPEASAGADGSEPSAEDPGTTDYDPAADTTTYNPFDPGADDGGDSAEGGSAGAGDGEPAGTGADGYGSGDPASNAWAENAGPGADQPGHFGGDVPAPEPSQDEGSGAFHSMGE